ncbi:hypothetical protein BDV28DRAFT_143619 [Aspergillus coremiiformis]|uniref:Uncharacterized protein n=1 Tax=Aspergillus coremiiformis TaxID=138285 RepID=A0A5N6YXI2_9EURO|nr:hypothetical protein BDV28DRAFT_143619 [Aspergillus coremiiformis]
MYKYPLAIWYPELRSRWRRLAGSIKMPRHVESSRSFEPEERGLGVKHSAQTLSLI